MFVTLPKYVTPFFGSGSGGYCPCIVWENIFEWISRLVSAKYSFTPNIGYFACISYRFCGYTINSLGKPRRQMVPRDALFLCEKPLPRCSLQLPSNKSTRLYQLVTDLHLSKAMRARLLVSFSRLRLANHCFHWTLHIVYPEYIHQEIQGVSPTSVVGDPWNPGRRLPTSYMLSRGLR